MLYATRYLLLLICLATGIHCFGQTLTGAVVDKTTRLAISGALVSMGRSKTYTNSYGVFELTPSSLTDSLKITHFAYKTYSALVNKATGTLRIELEPLVISLNTVTVKGSRDFKQDSINNRITYASQFNYKGPTVMDAFSGNPNKQPGELISVNPLILIAALTKKSTPEYKFRQTLLRDEQSDYVDRKFNRGIVGQVTGLKGDTLAEFVTRYRPTYEYVKKSTDYDIEVYIKESLKAFEREGVRVDDPFREKSE